MIRAPTHEDIRHMDPEQKRQIQAVIDRTAEKLRRKKVMQARMETEHKEMTDAHRTDTTV
jgi:hypothetical protein